MLAEEIKALLYEKRCSVLSDIDWRLMIEDRFGELLDRSEAVGDAELHAENLEEELEVLRLVLKAAKRYLKQPNDTNRASLAQAVKDAK